MNAQDEATINRIAGYNGFDAVAAIQDYPRLEAEADTLRAQVAALRDELENCCGYLEMFHKVSDSGERKVHMLSRAKQARAVLAATAPKGAK